MDFQQFTGFSWSFAKCCKRHHSQ